MKPEGREFTPIQLRLIKKLVQQALADLEKAWQAVMPVKIGYLRSESNPQFAMVVTTSEIVVVVTLQVHLGDITREMFIAYPYSMLEPIKEKLYSGLLPTTWSRTAVGAAALKIRCRSVTWRLRCSSALLRSAYRI